MIQVTVNGKNRFIRDKFIHHQTDNDLVCVYKKHHITIAKQDTGDFYVTIKDQTGMYVVQAGGFGAQYCRYDIETIEDCLAMCIENILSYYGI